MRRVLAALAALCLLLGLGACGKDEPEPFQDGTYTAEFKDYDSYGYKDFIKVTVREGIVTQVVYDGKDPAGGLKTEDTKYADDMAALQDTSPPKYTSDLENQYVERQHIGDVDVLAGATYSSESFIALFTALEEQMAAGDTAPLVVDNIPVK